MKQLAENETLVESEWPDEAHEDLFKCVRTALNPASCQQEIGGSPRTNWNQVLCLAEKHDIIPLLYSALAVRANVPAAVAYQARLTSERIIGWNLRLAGELVHIIEILESHDIDATCYKGPALAIDLYGSFALRHCRDLDILVDAKDAIRAFEALLSDGYHRCDAHTERSLPELLHRDKDIILKNPASNVSVELHWSVCEPEFDQRLHGLRVWGGARTVAVLGRPVSVPGPEELLFLLSIHGQRHYWFCLKWLCDIAWFLRRFPEVDWDRVFAISETFGRRRSVLLPLQMVHDLLGVSLPAVVQSRLRKEGGIPFLCQESVRNLVSPVNRPFPADATPLLRSKAKAEIDVLAKQFRIRAKDRMSDRVRLVSGALFDFLQPDEQDILCHPLLSRIKPYYWVVQPLRLLRSHGLDFFLRTARGFVRTLLC